MQDRESDEPEMTDWERFAAEEYELLVAEEGANDMQPEDLWDDCFYISWKLLNGLIWTFAKKPKCLAIANWVHAKYESCVLDGGSVQNPPGIRQGRRRFLTHHVSVAAVSAECFPNLLKCLY